MSIKINDEYNWSEYTKEYSEQIKTIAEKENDLFITEYEIVDGEIQFKDKLHNNWKEIYSTAYRLKPKSIYECGCGMGMHLRNLKSILPETTRIGGCELLPSQVALGMLEYGLYGNIYSNIDYIDFTNTMDVLKFIPKSEFVFSQAVIMHLSTDNALQFLINMGLISTKYIMLVEGVKNHENWYDMVKECLPDFEFQLTSKYIDYGILLTRK